MTSENDSNAGTHLDNRDAHDVFKYFLESGKYALLQTIKEAEQEDNRKHFRQPRRERQRHIFREISTCDVLLTLIILHPCVRVCVRSDLGPDSPLFSEECFVLHVLGARSKTKPHSYTVVCCLLSATGVLLEFTGLRLVQIGTRDPDIG